MDWFGTPMRPLSGGYSGETFLVGEPGGDVVLRIYRRHPSRSLVDASLLRLVAGVLPVPEVLDVRAPHGQDPGVLVMSRLPGLRLDTVLATASAELRTVIGDHLGRLLAVLSGIPMLHFGFFDGADLQLRPHEAADDLQAWARGFRDNGRLALWSDAEWDQLLSLLEGAETSLQDGGSTNGRRDHAWSRNVLVHSDFNPKNVLVDPATGDVTGLLDWEFAHAGSPYEDVGNLTRFERHPDFFEAVVGALVAHAPPLVDDPFRLGRAADLWALVELAGHPDSNPVRELAGRLLQAQARAQDPLAWPWQTLRVSPDVAGD